MTQMLRPILPVLLVMSAIGAHAQFYKKLLMPGTTVSAGATGQFTSVLTANPSPGIYAVPFNNNTYTTTVSNQQQYTTESIGFIGSLNLQPRAWAGVELNYSFTFYDEHYNFNYAIPNGAQTLILPTDAHEATAAYSFHPKGIPFKPFLNLGGGAIDFSPRGELNQWRGTVLAELGAMVPLPAKGLSLKVEGRGLFYRAPNFYNSAISTRSWRATEGPSVSLAYTF